MSVYDESLKLHEKYHGKLKVEAKVPCEDAKDLSLAYTPGVAEPCRKIHEDKEISKMAYFRMPAFLSPILT